MEQEVVCIEQQNNRLKKAYYITTVTDGKKREFLENFGLQELMQLQELMVLVTLSLLLVLN